MKYRSYHLSFPHGIHIGERNLDESLPEFRSDTLFSALYMEALKISDEMADRFLQGTSKGEILLSDAFPFIGETDYLPKPMWAVESPDQQGDSVIKKAFKALSYVPMNSIGTYLEGKLDAVAEKEKLSGLGRHWLKVSASIAGEEETRPYRVGSFHFGGGNGLFLIVGSEDNEKTDLTEELLRALSYTGIGGKRSAGFGRFCIERIGDLDSSAFEDPGSLFMSLSTSLPTDAELEDACDGASFQLIRRGGFIASETYAPEQRKKKDLYVMSAGSCFLKKFSGDVYDVGEGGSHPVYRYAKPIFWTLRR